MRLYDVTHRSAANNLLSLGISLFKVSRLLDYRNTRMGEEYGHADLESLRGDISKSSLDHEQTAPAFKNCDRYPTLRIK